jgi:hypothetical protein
MMPRVKKRVLILRRPQPFNPRALGIGNLLTPSLEDRIQAGLAKRLPNRSVVVGESWAGPQDFEILVPIVEGVEIPPLLRGFDLESMKQKAAVSDFPIDPMSDARRNRKRIIWVGVEGYPVTSSPFSDLLDTTLSIRDKTFEEDLDKLAQAIDEAPPSFSLADIYAGTASTSETATTSKADSRPQFDVFLCHNSGDKPVIRDINKRLTSRGVRCWLDEEQSRPGTEWQELLERQIESIQSAAVFVGPSGVGPWHNREMKVFINEFVERECKVIPVILEGVKTVPKLPLFWKGLTWVDFRNKEPDPLDQLFWGITGVRI